MNFIAPIKRHYSHKEVLAMSNGVIVKEEGGIPGFLRQRSTGASFGNIDASDLKPPQLKLLAGQSGQVIDGAPGAQPGTFWMTVLNMPMGPAVTGTPIIMRKSYHVWQPKLPNSDQKGPLASSSDGVVWDQPDQQWEIRYPQNQTVYHWKIGRLVSDYGVSKFGSSQPENPKSKPIATLTYDTLWVIDLPNGSKQLCVFTTARTGATPTQIFISTVRAMGIDQFYQRYRIIAIKKSGPTGDPYFSFEYQYIGTVADEAEADMMKGLYDQYRGSGFVVDTEAGAEDHPTSARDVYASPAKADLDDIPF